MKSNNMKLINNKLVEEIFWPDHMVVVGGRIVGTDFDATCQAVKDGKKIHYSHVREVIPRQPIG